MFAENSVIVIKSPENLGKGFRGENFLTNLFFYNVRGQEIQYNHHCVKIVVADVFLLLHDGYLDVFQLDQIQTCKLHQV
ncbi:hypothetical protein CCDG5_1272 [[Clostridium] cellulosi]|uniref:Uncharacterized protein n=1 Tax=[Clostridium] cellulosi TaxID=29343 RepID=A0A078KL25_9FIRM|nr:hypothetical protein CCDG5_1272 [[Clostridium] cellulosi]